MSKCQDRDINILSPSATSCKELCIILEMTSMFGVNVCKVGANITSLNSFLSPVQSCHVFRRGYRPRPRRKHSKKLTIYNHAFDRSQDHRSSANPYTCLPPMDWKAKKIDHSKCWKPAFKRRVAMLVGYIGTDYRGLQIQRHTTDLRTIEGELECAIFKAGGMLESNFGNLNKVGWTRSSRTDKGVHSLATVISMKLEIPIDAWVGDLDGLVLADKLNVHLPYNIRVFSVLPVSQDFDARKKCISRKYTYLLPAEVIGINENSLPEEIENCIAKFRDILSSFEGRHPFHNYTVRAQYRKSKLNTLSKRPKAQVAEASDDETSKLKTDDDLFEIDESREPEMQVLDDNAIDEGSEESGSSIERLGIVTTTEGSENIVPPLQARWLHEPDMHDKLSAAHFRRILSFTCSDLQSIKNQRYIELMVHGDSFMFHQIRKMIGTSVAVVRGVLPPDIIKLSLSRFSRIVLPIAPSEVLILHSSQFSCTHDSWGDYKESAVVLSGETKLSNLGQRLKIDARVNDFYFNTLLPALADFLDPSQPLWSAWLENLDEKRRLPDNELNEVRKAWDFWYAKHLARTEEINSEALELNEYDFNQQSNLNM